MDISTPGRSLVRVPRFSLPTSALAILTFSAWCWVSWQAFSGGLSLPLAFVLNTALAYVSFTPQHDAVHGSISSKYKWWNEWIGRLAGIPLF